MIKIIVVLIIFILASSLLGGSLGILFDTIGLGATSLFFPMGMIIQFLNEIFSGVFKNYYILILLSIFLFIIIFFFTLNFFVDVFKERVRENESIERSFRMNKKYRNKKSKLEKKELEKQRKKENNNSDKFTW